ncbi:hypothetical protein MSMTP_0136 [Methanosarcina sp. MTP4]|nr:hypothetical protein MSMTP_0136 [Methanosarcina sp. MTP4]
MLANGLLKKVERKTMKEMKLKQTEKRIKFTKNTSKIAFKFIFQQPSINFHGKAGCLWHPVRVPGSEKQSEKRIFRKESLRSYPADYNLETRASTYFQNPFFIFCRSADSSLNSPGATGIKKRKQKLPLNFYCSSLLLIFRERPAAFGTL